MRTGLRRGVSVLRRLLLPDSSAPEAEEVPVLRGKLRCTVVVSEPGEPFSEAVFVLRDSALREPGISRMEVLDQAREAAGFYTRDLFPEKAGLRPLAAFLLGASTSLLLMLLLGLL